MYKDLQARYCFDGNLSKLFERVVNHVTPDHPDREVFLEEMCALRFIPAGGTLTAGSGREITPNCSVIGMINETNLEAQIDKYTTLLQHATGVGVNLSGVDDPVAVLERMSLIASSVQLQWDRPLRGNIAILNASHPRVEEFISCKLGHDRISMFNISVGFTDNDMKSERGKHLLSLISRSAHKSAEPGVVYLDRVDGLCACSPCGELFMHEGETCNLGSINLDKFVVGGEFDWDLYRVSIALAIRFLDAVIDKQYIPIESMRQTTLRYRRIGLGVQGFATTLDMLGLRCGSMKSVDMALQLSKTLTRTANEESKRLASSLGTQLSNGMRNISTTAIPPTGGIRRLVADDGFAIEPKFASVLSVSWQEAILIQSAWQAYVSNAVSKTVNLPEDSTPHDIYEAYAMGFALGCKGITVYRDNSLSYQPIQCSDGTCG